MGRTDSKGLWAYTKDGFRAIRVLDNSNIYGVVLAEMISNIFKEGMWFKALTPYMLILTNNDAIQVGNMLTLNGITRAFVGVVSGRMAINKLGVEVVWVVTGFIGLVGILINVVCLSRSSVPAAYILNFTWAVYNGLWNSCLETSWSRSIVRDKREDVNGARQITNKVTTSLGPLFSAAIFLWCGNTWSIELVQHVMLFGTTMTLFTVILCFCFRHSEEVEQDMPLIEVESMTFATDLAGNCKEFQVSELRFSSFVKEARGVVKLTYPLGHDDDDDSWHSRIRIATKDFKETNYILVKQYHAAFSGIHTDVRTCVIGFEDTSRPPERVNLHSVQVFLSQDEGGGQKNALVNRYVSKIHFSLNPREGDAPQSFEPARVLSNLVMGRSYWIRRQETVHMNALKEALMPSSREPLKLVPYNLRESIKMSVKGRKAPKEHKPNINGANIIVVCDVLNALGAGFSLKFMDLFLKVDYGVSPAGVFMVGFLQNIFGAYFTPHAKRLLANMRRAGFRAKLGVVILWSLALCFLAVLCIPGMPIWVVIPSIVMMQSLNSCTRAYNRAQLNNYLPREKIANYMTWDALNKANQGGVAIFGAQVVAIAGYRGCFMGTFVILFVRLLVYLAFTLRKGTIYKRTDKDKLEAAGGVKPTPPTEADVEDGEVSEKEMNGAENIRPNQDGEEESQMFQPAEALAFAADPVQPTMDDLQVYCNDADFVHSPEGSPRRRSPSSPTGSPAEPRRSFLQPSAAVA